jgi:excisionase family DNA binding protein
MPATTNTNDRRTYTVQEAARLLGISRGVAYEAVRTGQIRAITVGRRILIPPSALTELLGHEPPAPSDLQAPSTVR